MEGTSTRTVIREMVEEDLPQVLEIERLSFSIPWTEDAFRFELRNRETGRRLLVAERDGRLEGYIVYWVIEGSGEILDVAVAPRRRRRGIASRLVREAVTDMERMGAESIHLEIRASNKAARDLYGRYGFEKSYLRRGYYENPREDAWVLRLKLRD